MAPDRKRGDRPLTVPHCIDGDELSHHRCARSGNPCRITWPCCIGSELYVSRQHTVAGQLGRLPEPSPGLQVVNNDPCPG